jgi:hypothetical protein
MDELIGSRLGEYLIKRRIATGGMASVFEAEHRRTGDLVAIKVLAADLRERGDPLARILQEGRVVTGLLHEHIVRVFEHGTADENVGFVVMELLTGESIADVLDREQYLDPERAVFIARQVCAGLGAAHARDVFHRDVKPGNIVLAEGQKHADFVKLLDFGIAKLHRDDPARLAATAKGMTLGTPQYMSPEQVTGDAIDARSDVYQVGILLYEMLTGEPPFLHVNPVSCMAMHLQSKPRPIRERRPLVTEDLEQIVLKCLEKRPSDRYADALSLADALEHLALRFTLREGDRSAIEERPAVLPVLGAPAADDFAARVAQVAGRLWPAGLPAELAGQLKRLADLAAERERVVVAHEAARSEATALAAGITARLAPLERAIRTLEQALVEQHAQADQAASEAHRHQGRLAAIDIEYARIYDEIETQQRTLLGSGAGAFRHLFRQDIDAHLAELEIILGRRMEVLQAREVAAQVLTAQLRHAADLELQLGELRRSAQAVEMERVTRVAQHIEAQEALAAQLARVERTLLHEQRVLGLVFRQATAAQLA